MAPAFSCLSPFTPTCTSVHHSLISFLLYVLADFHLSSARLSLPSLSSPVCSFCILSVFFHLPVFGPTVMFCLVVLIFFLTFCWPSPACWLHHSLPLSALLWINVNFYTMSLSCLPGIHCVSEHWHLGIWLYGDMDLMTKRSSASFSTYQCGEDIVIILCHHPHGESLKKKMTEGGREREREIYKWIERHIWYFVIFCTHAFSQFVSCITM